MAWSACLSLPFDNREEWDFVTKQMSDKFKMTEEETLYFPPEVQDGILKSAILVSEGVLVEPKHSMEGLQQENENTPVTPMPQSHDSDSVEKEVVVDELRGNSEEDVDLAEHPLEVIEEGGDSLGDRA